MLFYKRMICHSFIFRRSGPDPLRHDSLACITVRSCLVPDQNVALDGETINICVPQRVEAKRGQAQALVSSVLPEPHGMESFLFDLRRRRFAEQRRLWREGSSDVYEQKQDLFPRRVRC